MIKGILKDYLQAEGGATSVEYALFVGIFSVGFIAMWVNIQDDVLPNFSTISDNLHLDAAADDAPAEAEE